MNHLSDQGEQADWYEWGILYCFLSVIIPCISWYCNWLWLRSSEMSYEWVIVVCCELFFILMRFLKLILPIWSIEIHRQRSHLKPYKYLINSCPPSFNSYQLCIFTRSVCVAIFVLSIFCSSSVPLGGLPQFFSASNLCIRSCCIRIVRSLSSNWLCGQNGIITISSHSISKLKCLILWSFDALWNVLNWLASNTVFMQCRLIQIKTNPLIYASN